MFAIVMCLVLNPGTVVASSSGQQTLLFHCSTHSFPISLNFRGSSKVHGVTRENIVTFFQ